MHCGVAVQNEVGLGRREEAYHRACVLWLRANGVPYQSKPPHHLLFGVHVAHTLIPDLVLWDRITAELKAVRRLLVAADAVQLFDYLKCRNDDLGLLVNFGLDGVHCKRYPYNQRQYRLKEDWQHWKGILNPEARDAGVATCRLLRNIYHTHQTGYGQEASQKLILGALAHVCLPFEPQPIAKASFQGHCLDESALDCLLIVGCIVLVSTALLDSNQLATGLALSYMKTLGVEMGVAVNFGKTEAQFTGLRRKLPTFPSRS